MKLTKSLFTIFLISGLISISNSQTVDDIINSYITAIGGMDKINSIQTVIVAAKFSGMGVDIPVMETVKRPDKVRQEMTFQGQQMTRAYDGTVAWGTNPFSGSKDPEKMNAEETKDMKELIVSAIKDGTVIDHIPARSLFKVISVELLGKEDMDGTDVYKIKLTDKDGDITTFYFDAKSYLLIKAAGKRKMKEKEINFETVYGDYKSEDGYLMPHSFEVKSGGDTGGGQKILIDKVEFNTPVDDSIFTMPETEKK